MNTLPLVAVYDYSNLLPEKQKLKFYLSKKGLKSMYYIVPCMYPMYSSVPMTDSRNGQHPMYYPAPPMMNGSPDMGPFPGKTEERQIPLRDYGGAPYVVDIEDAAEQNRAFRTALWTGDHLQVTLMSIRPGESIGLERHPQTDQFLRIEDGNGLVRMGRTRENLNFERRIGEDDAIMVPAGYWHNIINTGREPLKLYSIYAPPEHPFGTIHRTKAEAMAAEH